MPDRRGFITVSKPPLEVFEEGHSVFQQDNMYEGATPGELFDRTDYPEEGDMLTYYYEHAFPMKGEPYPTAVDAIQAPKKLIMATFQFARRHFLLFGFFLLLPNFITRRYVKSLLEFYLNNYVSAVISPNFLAPKRWCRSVREILRAGKKVVEDYSGTLKEYLMPGLKAFASTLQWDNAHRYRFQDVAGEVNKEAFMQTPSKEIQRLVMIQVSRERGWYGEKARYFVVGWVLRMVLLLKPSVKKFLKEFVQELNLDEVKLDEGDEYHNLLRPDYDVHGWPIEHRQKRYLKIYDEYVKANPTRIQEGKNRKEQGMAFANMKMHLEQEPGIPFMLFIVMPGDKQSTVKMVETKLSLEHPQLKESCVKILEGGGAGTKDIADKEAVERKELKQ